jgi:hypothetical protein
MYVFSVGRTGVTQAVRVVCWPDTGVGVVLSLSHGYSEARTTNYFGRKLHLFLSSKKVTDYHIIANINLHYRCYDHHKINFSLIILRKL